MHRTPVGPQRSPGFSPRPSPDWTFPGVRSPFGGSPRFSPGFSPGSPRGSPRFSRGNMDGSPGHYGGGGRGFGGPVRRGGGFRRPQSFSPSGAPNLQARTPDVPVEKFFSPSMIQDPWRTLQPVSPEAAARRTNQNTATKDQWQ